MSDMIRTRIDEATKAKATAALASMGLTVSDAVRMMMHRVAAEGALPFEVRIPNAETRASIKELKAGKGERFDSIESLMADLHEED